jgi:aminotransferase
MAALPEMFDRTISCSSLSKTYNMTGWRLGYVIGSKTVIAAARKVHDFLTVGAPAPCRKPPPPHWNCPIVITSS